MQIIIPTAIVIFLYMVIVFFIALLKKDNSIVDIFWGPGFILVAFFSIMQGEPVGLHKILLNLLVLLWGSRLSVYIYLRNKGKEEDFRYKAWRDTWKFFILRSFFQIFMLQGIFILIVALPIYYVNFSQEVMFSPVDTIGIILFTIGFCFEAVGDYQMSVFKKQPKSKGKLMTTGLWRITRHPNYFGEALIWWGISCFALDYSHGWKTLLSPLMITLLLRFVSGVPMLEKKYEGRTDWEEYKKKTSAFVPFLKFL
jgi:steroid 5-alpha reductase family enzyme